MPLADTSEKERRRRALTRRLRQAMDDALPGELTELAVPAPRAEFLTVVFLEQREVGLAHPSLMVVVSVHPCVVCLF